MFGCQQDLIKCHQETRSILEYLCSESAKLINCGTYYPRQLFFKTGHIPNRGQLHKVIGTENQNKHYKTFYSDTAQQILTGVVEGFKSYLTLVESDKRGILNKVTEK